VWTEFRAGCGRIIHRGVADKVTDIAA